jgi:hypothetical protein
MNLGNNFYWDAREIIFYRTWRFLYSLWMLFWSSWSSVLNRFYFISFFFTWLLTNKINQSIIKIEIKRWLLKTYYKSFLLFNFHSFVWLADKIENVRIPFANKAWLRLTVLIQRLTYIGFGLVSFDESAKVWLLYPR